MSRGFKLDLEIAGVEEVKKHLGDLQAKYIACFTNVNNIRSMLRQINKDIKDGNGDMKTLDIAVQEQTNVLLANLSGIKLHRKNIIFLKDALGVE